MAAPLTDHAIAKIRDMIISGEFVAGARLPKEQELAARLGLSRNSSGNATLASPIQNLSGGMLRARLWRSITEHGATEVTLARHWDIYRALRARDAEQASAADLAHLSDSEHSLRRVIESEEGIMGRRA